jgi:hypothetical protein
MTWKGAGGWVIVSHDRQGNVSRTVWISFHCPIAPLPRHDRQGLGEGLAEFGPLAAAARAGGRSGDHDALARQMGWKRGPHRLPAGEAANSIAGPLYSRGCVLGRARCQFLTRPFELVEQRAAALGGLPKPLALQRGDQQFVMGDQRLSAGGARLGLLARRALGGQRRLSRVDLGREGRARARHKPDCPILPTLSRYSTTG